jgi:hypothetical protein
VRGHGSVVEHMSSIIIIMVIMSIAIEWCGWDPAVSPPAAHTPSGREEDLPLPLRHFSPSESVCESLVLVGAGDPEPSSGQLGGVEAAAAPRTRTTRQLHL